MKISILTSVAAMLVLNSSSVFAMGRTDQSQIAGQLNLAKAAGYKCDEVWPKGFYLSQAEPSSNFTVGLSCKNAAGKTIEGSIVYQADTNQYAKCRDIRAVAIDLNLNLN